MESQQTAEAVPVFRCYRGRRLVTRVCQQCSAYFGAHAADIKRGKGRFCSYRCTGRAVGVKTLINGYGEANANWKGGLATNNVAYRKLYRARHPVAATRMASTR